MLRISSCRFLAFITGLLVAMPLASSFAAPENGPAVRIPVMVAQTGAGAVFGKNELDAYTLAIEEWNGRGGVNGRKVELNVIDSETSQAKILSAYHKIALDRPPAILGPTWLDTYPGVIPLAQRDGIALITPSAAFESFIEKNASWPISFYHNSTNEAESLSRGVVESGARQIAIIYEQEPFAELLVKLTKTAFRKFNSDTLTISDIGVAPGEADFNAVISRMRSQRIEAVLIYLWDERSLVAFLKQLNRIHSEARLFTVHDGAGWLTMDAVKPLISELTYTEFKVADPSFSARFQKRFAYPPILTASNAYDALNAVLSAIQSGANNGEEVNKFIQSKLLHTVTFGDVQYSRTAGFHSTVDLVAYKAKP